MTISPNENQQLLRQLPSIDKLLQQPECADLLSTYGRSLTVNALRSVLETSRKQIIAGNLTGALSDQEIIQESGAYLSSELSLSLYPVINATGIIVHTNLGRAPLSRSALAAMLEVAEGYSNLEYDTSTGKRGSRTAHAQKLLAEISGAEQALVVNNNAAAVLLMLTALCRDREVIISRGQLIEIGGGFRIPEVMAQSGAHLVEVGTTNRTHLFDYQQAINERTAAILVAHPSNYRVIGFTSEPTLSELAALAHQNKLLMLYDQGSGALLDVTPFGLDHEPTVGEALSAGADIVAFSGDKLLGGPQAGILCGRTELIEKLEHHPLARAVRADKLGLSALSMTLTHYLKEEAFREIPVWQMISKPLETIAQTARQWSAELQKQNVAAQIVDGRSRVGGGSLPGTSLPTKLVALISDDAEGLAARLRNAPVPIIGRIQDDYVLLDPRTVLDFQEEDFLNTLFEICTAQ